MNIHDKWQQASEPEIPEWSPEEMWDRIEPELPPRRRRKLLIWWFLSGALLLSAGVFAYYLRQITPSPAQVHTQERAHAQVAPNPATNAQSAAAATPLSYPSDKVIFEKNINKYSKKTAQNKSKQIASIPSASIAIGQKNLENTSSQKPLTPLLFAQENSPNKPTTHFNSIPILPTLPLALFASSHKLPDLVPLKMPNPTEKPALPSWHKNSFSIESGLFYTWSAAKASTVEAQTYSNAKNQAEKLLETIHFSGMYHFALLPQLELGAGLTWQRTALWFRYTDTQVTQVQIPSDSASFYQFNGVNYYSPGYLTEEKTITSRLIAPASLERYSIPVQVRWTLPLARARVRLTGGTAWNFNSNYRGYTLDTQPQLVDKNAGTQQNIYRSSGVHSVYAGMEYRRSFRRHWYWQLGLRYQQDVSSIIQPGILLDQRLYTVGGILGVGYTFEP